MPEIPPELKRKVRASFLSQLLAFRGLDSNELSLFEWFERESEALIEKMLREEKAWIKEQVDAGHEDINDSGIVAVEYFVKRSRYSHVIFLASLLETYLDEACKDLTKALEEQNVPFRLDELSGDKWSKRKKFLERYGHFQIPEAIWSPVSSITAIRNVLVHENGNCAGISDKQKQEFRRILGINVDGYEMAIEPKFIGGALSSLRELVNFVDAKLREVIARAIRPQA